MTLILFGKTVHNVHHSHQLLTFHTNSIHTFHVSPSAPRNCAWLSKLFHCFTQPFIFKYNLIADCFPFPLNALTLSHPVDAWKPGNASQVFSPYFWDIPLISMKRRLFPLPVARMGETDICLINCKNSHIGIWKLYDNGLVSLLTGMSWM